MTSTKTVAVAGAGATNSSATAAVNLALAFAALGLGVELRDGDAPACPAAAALVGRPAAAVALGRGRPMEILARIADEGPRAAADVIVESCAPRLDPATAGTLAAADAVLVAVDGTAVSLRALDAVAGLRPAAAAHPVLVLLTRSLSRSVDRWALVDGLGERDDVRLASTTVSLGRRSGSGTGGRADRPATLYAPTTRAAAAYRSVARELAGAMGLELPHLADAGGA